MTPDDILTICEQSTAADWVYWVYVPHATPGVVPASPAASRRGAASGHSARAAYRHDLDVGLAWGIIRQQEIHPPEWESASLDASRCFWVDLICEGRVAERYLAVSVQEGRAALPAPRIERREDGGVTLWVSRRKHAVVRLANEIDPECSGFDECFARSRIEVR